MFDVWEHAHYVQYRNIRVDFVNALWNVEVGKRERWCEAIPSTEHEEVGDAF